MSWNNDLSIFTYPKSLVFSIAEQLNISPESTLLTLQAGCIGVGYLASRRVRQMPGLTPLAVFLAGAATAAQGEYIYHNIKNLTVTQSPAQLLGAVAAAVVLFGALFLSRYAVSVYTSDLETLRHQAILGQQSYVTQLNQDIAVLNSSIRNGHSLRGDAIEEKHKRQIADLKNEFQSELNDAEQEFQILEALLGYYDASLRFGISLYDEPEEDSYFADMRQGGVSIEVLPNVENPEEILSEDSAASEQDTV